MAPPLYLPPDHIAILATVIPAGCTSQAGTFNCQRECPVLDGFGGTYGGAPMKVMSPGGLDQARGSCMPPSLLLDVGTDNPMTTNTVELHDAMAAIRATFPIDVLEPRHATTSDGGALCAGKLEHITWSHPADLAASSSAVTMHWMEDGIRCTEGCTSRGGFSAPVSITGADQLSFTAPSNVELYWGHPSSAGHLTLIVPGAIATGSADTCEGAATCTYDFAHAAIVAATYTPSCP